MIRQLCQPFTGARDRGAATIEQLSVIVVVVLLASSATLGLANYGPHLSSKLCDIASTMGMAPGGCAPVLPLVAEGDGLTDEDLLPGVCTLRETATQTSSKVKLGFITFGENAGFLVAEDSDGTVSVTVSSGAELGAEGGVGAEAGKDGLALGAKVDFGAGLKFEAGSTWTFDSMDDWLSMKSDFDAYHVQQMQMRHGGMGAAGLHVYWGLTDGYLDPPRPPNMTSSTIGLDVYADAQAGLKVEVGKGSNGESKWFDPNRGIYGEGTLGGSVTRTYDSDTEFTSETYTFTSEGGVGVNWGIANGGLEGEFEQAYRITKDGNDEVVSIEFMRETGGRWTGEIDMDPGIVGVGGDNSGSLQIGADKENQRTVQTTAVKVNDGNREVVSDWIEANKYAPTGNPFIYPANAFEPAESVEGDPFAEVLHREAKSSLRIYDNVASGFSFGAEFALGLKLGLSFEHEESETTINSAYFAGAPLQDGVRPYLEDSTCVL